MALFDRMVQTSQGGNPYGNPVQALRARQAGLPMGGGNQFSPQNAFAQAIPTQAEDYDEIMGGYRQAMGGPDPYSALIAKYKGELESPGNAYKEVTYQESPEYAQAFAKAKEYAETGGLNEAEQGSLRARAISPIRSVYANMQRNMDRQRSLSGGFSPNYNASASRMAREGSEQIASTTTNANAAIAEMVQKGKLAMTPEMAKLATSKNSLMNEVALQNAANAAKFADQRGQTLAGLRAALEAQAGRKTEALRGMTSLYGTNPALVETYSKINQGQQQIGNQANQAAAENKTRRQGLAMRGGGGGGGGFSFGGY